MDRPILFSGPMVRAILDGRKTQTRRILKPQPPRGDHYGRDIMDWGLSGIYQDDENSAPNKWWLDVQTDVDDNSHCEIDVRYAAGDRLWVREAWRSAAPLDDTAPRDMDDLLVPPVRYEADGEAVNWKEWRGHDAGRLRAAMHMPRWASRLTLIVADVRVHRLNEISDEDAIAEGVINTGRREGAPYDHFAVPGCAEAGMEHGPVPVFGNLWEFINGEGSWNANPWVVAIGFSVERRNIDQVAS